MSDMNRGQAVDAVNAARQARDAAFEHDPCSDSTVRAYLELGTAYRNLARLTDDEVAKTAMHEAADALALLAGNVRMTGRPES